MNKTKYPPVDTAVANELLERYQSIWETLQVLGKKDVDYIVSGVEVQGTNVTAGFVIIAGELLEFKSGTKNDYIIIVENETIINVGSGSYIEVSRHVEFGTGTGQIAFSLIQSRRADDSIFQKKIDIGSWDMQALGSVVFDLHTLLPNINLDDVLSVTAFIRSDSDQTGNYEYDDLLYDGRVQYSIAPQAGTSTVTLSRKTGGIFDSADYSVLATSRGHLTIKFK